MTYRPQYAYPAPPPGWEDETFSYSFDGTTTPLLNVAIAAGAYANNIMLPMEQDCGFLCRAIKIGLATASSSLYMELKTPHGDYLSKYVPSSNWNSGTGLALAGLLPVPLEEQIECPAGSVWSLFLYNPTLGSVNPPAITLYGVKRRRCADRMAA